MIRPLLFGGSILTRFLISLFVLFFFVSAAPVPKVYPDFPITKKHMIAFRGLNSVIDEQTLTDWCEENRYVLRVFNHEQTDAALTYALTLKTVHLELLGFSKGAESAYELAEDLVDVKKIRRLITVGTYHTVTTSFATKRRPKLKNVKVHYNFVETAQQPENFKANPINVSVGKVDHLTALKESFKLIDASGARYQ